MMTVPLHGKKAADRVALIDDQDWDLLMPYHWYVLEQVRRGRTHGPYAVATVWTGAYNRAILMHKLITGWPMTDHRDRDGLNNQRSNLRPATRSQNQANRSRDFDGSSRFKGVSWDKRFQKWSAQIGQGGRKHFLGYFAAEEAAARAYDAAARVAFGEYAHLNFP